MNSVRLNLIYSFCVSFKGAQGSQGTSGIPGLAGPTVSYSGCNTLKSVWIKSKDARFLLLKLQSLTRKMMKGKVGGRLRMCRAFHWI